MDIKILNYNIQVFNDATARWMTMAEKVTSRPIQLFQERQLHDELVLSAAAEQLNNAGKEILSVISKMGFNPVGLSNGEPCKRDSGGRIIAFCTFPPVPEEK